MVIREMPRTGYRPHFQRHVPASPFPRWASTAFMARDTQFQLGPVRRVLRLRRGPSRYGPRRPGQLLRPRSRCQPGAMPPRSMPLRTMAPGTMAPGEDAAQEDPAQEGPGPRRPSPGRYRPGRPWPGTIPTVPRSWPLQTRLDLGRAYPAPSRVPRLHAPAGAHRVGAGGRPATSVETDRPRKLMTNALRGVHRPDRGTAGLRRAKGGKLPLGAAGSHPTGDRCWWRSGTANMAPPVPGQTSLDG